ncbi:MAG: aspartate aminotransferase family protein [Flavobacteriaceae bacterium]|nr:aspartate aminotransferase family protein [Flavobacteriaceae bacterium]
MSELAQAFHQYLAKTTPIPLGLEILKAKGTYLYDKRGNSYLDFVSGVSACNLGHSHPKINRAIYKQLRLHNHIMVYGELIQKPVVSYAKLLIDSLPETHQKFYPTNSGTEAMEGAIKLAKKATHRSQIISAKHGYHGSSQGSLSILGQSENRNPFRPLIPGNQQIRFNDFEDLREITTKTAAVVLETIQGGAGFIVPQKDYLKKVGERCHEKGALLILDEIQTGFGRLGTLFGFEQFDVVPDILVIGKSMASGLPVGGFTASKKLMDQLANEPPLGHITTFGGHPVVMASALKTLEIIQTLIKTNLIQKKERLFRSLLIHEKIKEIRGRGLMLALILPSAKKAQKLMRLCLEHRLITFGLLWEKSAVRITPSLIIPRQDIIIGCRIILQCLDKL